MSSTWPFRWYTLDMERSGSGSLRLGSFAELRRRDRSRRFARRRALEGPVAGRLTHVPPPYNVLGASDSRGRV